ncbi:hypothetical protein [Marinicellulosiphila megalodicopiae]|uniref:hypothetical protein n=1 Tax=Marinicellulosiphila megalodicopiae TaxID=2724896 RepID=UPI003BB21D16
MSRSIIMMASAIMMFACNSTETKKEISPAAASVFQSIQMPEKTADVSVNYEIKNNVDAACLNEEKHKIYQAALNLSNISSLYTDKDGTVNSMIVRINSFTQEQCPYIVAGKTVQFETNKTLREKQLTAFIDVHQITYEDDLAKVNYGTASNARYGNIDVRNVDGDWFAVGRSGQWRSSSFARSQMSEVFYGVQCRDGSQLALYLSFHKTDICPK